MVENESCILCGYPITDPVCGKCFIRQTKITLTDLKVHPLAIEIILKKLKSKLSIETMNEAECILCRKEKLTLCGYCFSFALMNILRELNLPEEFVIKFKRVVQEEEFPMTFL